MLFPGVKFQITDTRDEDDEDEVGYLLISALLTSSGSAASQSSFPAACSAHNLAILLTDPWCLRLMSAEMDVSILAHQYTCSIAFVSMQEHAAQKCGGNEPLLGQ